MGCSSSKLAVEEKNIRNSSFRNKLIKDKNINSKNNPNKNNSIDNKIKSSSTTKKNHENFIEQNKKQTDNDLIGKNLTSKNINEKIKIVSDQTKLKNNFNIIKDENLDKKENIHTLLIKEEKEKDYYKVNKNYLNKEKEKKENENKKEKKEKNEDKEGKEGKEENKGSNFEKKTTELKKNDILDKEKVEEKNNYLSKNLDSKEEVYFNEYKLKDNVNNKINKDIQKENYYTKLNKENFKDNQKIFQEINENLKNKKNENKKLIEEKNYQIKMREKEDISNKGKINEKLESKGNNIIESNEKQNEIAANEKKKALLTFYNFEDEKPINFMKEKNQSKNKKIGNLFGEYDNNNTNESFKKSLNQNLKENKRKKINENLEIQLNKNIKINNYNNKQKVELNETSNENNIKEISLNKRNIVDSKNKIDNIKINQKNILKENKKNNYFNNNLNIYKDNTNLYPNSKKNLDETKFDEKNYKIEELEILENYQINIKNLKLENEIESRNVIFYSLFRKEILCIYINDSLKSLIMYSITKKKEIESIRDIENLNYIDFYSDGEKDYLFVQSIYLNFTLFEIKESLEKISNFYHILSDGSLISRLFFINEQINKSIILFFSTWNEGERIIDLLNKNGELIFKQNQKDLKINDCTSFSYLNLFYIMICMSNGGGVRIYEFKDKKLKFAKLFRVQTSNWTCYHYLSCIANENKENNSENIISIVCDYQYSLINGVTKLYIWDFNTNNLIKILHFDNYCEKINYWLNNILFFYEYYHKNIIFVDYYKGISTKKIVHPEDIINVKKCNHFKYGKVLLVYGQNNITLWGINSNKKIKTNLNEINESKEITNLNDYNYKDIIPSHFELLKEENNKLNRTNITTAVTFKSIYLNENILIYTNCILIFVYSLDKFVKIEEIYFEELIDKKCTIRGFINTNVTRKLVETCQHFANNKKDYIIFIGKKKVKIYEMKEKLKEIFYLDFCDERKILSSIFNKSKINVLYKKENDSHIYVYDNDKKNDEISFLNYTCVNISEIKILDTFYLNEKIYLIIKDDKNLTYVYDYIGNKSLYNINDNGQNFRNSTNYVILTKNIKNMEILIMEI